MGVRPDPDSYDPLSEAVQTNPFPYYDLFRDSCPVRRYRLTDAQRARTAPEGNPMIGEPVDELYMVFDHDLIRDIAADFATYRCGAGVGPERAIPPNGVGMLLFADPPHHGPQRAIVAAALSPRLVKHMETLIAEYADRLIDGFADAGSVDMMQEFCIPLPGLIFCELLGVSTADRPMLKKWGDATVDAFGGDAEEQQRAVLSMMEMMQYFAGLLVERRAAAERGEELPHDLLTNLMETEVEGRRFDDIEIFQALQVLIAGGNDTTASALGNGVHQLCRHPEQQRMLRDDPALLPDAVEEILRIDTPVPSLFRTTTREVTVAGVHIPAESKVGLVWGAANSDPAKFDRPGEFDITRPRAELRQHVTFGLGPHYCVGSALGRALVRIGLERLLARLPELRPDPTRPNVRHDALIARRFENLYVRW
jgi:cytochrome P450